METGMDSEAGRAMRPREQDAMAARAMAADSVRIDIKLQLGDHVEALEAAEAYRARWPDAVFGWFVVAECLLALGRYREAACQAQGFVAMFPDSAVAYAILGRARLDGGEKTEAARPLQWSLTIDPHNQGVTEDLADLCWSLDWTQDALPVFERLHAMTPDTPEIMLKLAALKNSVGDYDAAALLYQRVVTLAPDDPVPYFHLVGQARERGKFDMALGLCSRFLHLRPNTFAGLVELGLTQRGRGRPDLAYTAYREAAELQPASLPPYVNIVSVCMDLGWTTEAVRTTRWAMHLDPVNVAGGANHVMYSHYLPERTPTELRATVDDWAAHFVQPAVPRQPIADPDPDRPLRVGMLSSGFLRHPALSLSIAALEAMDRDAITLIAYSDRRRKDELTARLKACAEVHYTGDLKIDALADRIREDRIDILIDMAGHSSGCRLQLYPSRPAPVQVKWVGGLFNTSGIPGLDWLLADSVEVPPGDDDWYTERVYRLPDGYVVFDPPDYAPPVWPLPARLRGQVTFGSFNNPVKVNERMVRLWGQILERVPNSRLLLKGSKFGVPQVRRLFHEQFAARGIDPERIAMRGMTEHRDQLRTFNEVDIALDPWPYSGGLTTCESMWMGVPVVSWPGPTFAGRHAASHLKNVGLDDWIVDSEEAYVDLAVSWANRLDDLAVLRQGLRDRLAASPLCDGRRFARNLEAAFRHMWRTTLEEDGYLSTGAASRTSAAD